MVFRRRRRDSAPSARPGAGTTGPTGASYAAYDQVSRLAHEHLPAEHAREWLSLVRPGVRLAPAQSGEPVVARLGGAPVVPEGWEWPSEPESGPLPLVVEVDLAAVRETAAGAGVQLDLLLPESGRLLAFHAEGDWQDHDAVAESDPADLWDPGEERAARLVHVRAPREACTERTIPDGTPERPRQDLTGTIVATWPSDGESNAGSEVFERLQESVDLDDLDEFVEALGETWGEEPVHLVGGWADAMQTQPEDDVAAEHATDADGPPWSLLLQIDTLPPEGVDGLTWDWGALGRLFWVGDPTSARKSDELPSHGFTCQP